MDQTIIRRARGIAGTAAVLLALAGCGGDAGDATADFTPLPGGEAAQASGGLVEGSVADAVRATQEAIERSGVPVSSRGELLGYALDARRKSTQMRVDSNEFAQMLLAFGFPFQEVRPGSAPSRSRSMLDALDAAERDEVRSELGRAERAAREALQEDERAAEARYREQRQAIVEESQQRLEAANAAMRELSKASREERAAGWDAARHERDEALQAVSAARARARELEEAFRSERRTHTGAARLEQAAGRQVGPNHEAGRQLMELLAAWVRAAADDPDHPDSFVPLYLAEMARRQSDPIDLAGAPEAHRHRWSLLEMAMFAAAFQPEGRAAPAGTPVAALLDLLVPAAHAATPCEVAQQAWGSWGDVANVGNGQITNALLDHELRTVWGEQAAREMGNAISATAMIGKVLQLAAFYSHTQVTVESDVSQMHKPQGSFQRVTFTARAGVPAEEIEAYEEYVKQYGDDQALRDCLAWGGLPHADSIRDVAKDAEDWTLDWRLFGDGKHANWSRRDNMDAEFFGGGRVGKPMKRVSSSSAESQFVIRILPEKAHAGPLSTAKVEVRAEVDSAGMPSLGTLVGAGKGLFGVAESLVEIASGWAREVFKPKAYAVVDLELHCPDPTYVFRQVEDPVAWGGGDGTEGCTFHFDNPQQYQDWRAGWE